MIYKTKICNKNNRLRRKKVKENNLMEEFKKNYLNKKMKKIRKENKT